MKFLVTGVAGFIGSHLVHRLCSEDHEVIGVDNINDYYDVNLKESRLKEFSSYKNFIFEKSDLSNYTETLKIFEKYRFNRVIHLAAQAGVRYSIENPGAYVDSNLKGFLSILEGCRKFDVAHLVYASSSSVYGMNTKIPFSTRHSTDHPVALYGASKKANEVMAHSYSSLYQIPSTGLRFFTVYGPKGRPDMALFKFTRAILEDKEIEVFNEGNMTRDFTYIDDVIEAIVRVHEVIPQRNPSWSEEDLSSSSAPHKIYNVGNGSPVKLLDFIEEIENYLGKKAKRKLMPLQQGDVINTHSDCEELFSNTGFKPRINIREGVKNFLDWYLEYYKIDLKK